MSLQQKSKADVTVCLGYGLDYGSSDIRQKYQ